VAARLTRARAARAKHHNVYVVYLRNPRGDGKAGYYVGMTGLAPEARFENHKRGYKGAGVVRRFGERLVPKLYEHLNPMTYEEAAAMERQLADELRARGYQVFGGH
jgi:hypothetical protein